MNVFMFTVAWFKLQKITSNVIKTEFVPTQFV